MIQVPIAPRDARAAILVAGFCLFASVAFLPGSGALRAQTQQPSYSPQEKPIAKEIRGLRRLPDDVRGLATKNLAIQIRQLPKTPNKLSLANELASLSTEGDFGHDTLQEVAITLAAALRERPVPEKKGQPAAPYVELAQLVRYEHVQASLGDPQFGAATSKLEADDERRQHIDFTLKDLNQETWTLKDLRGKVVLVNFWATWCPPCRKEMPDLEKLYKQFKDQDLIILAISDESASKVNPFVAEQKVTYPILLDPGRKVNMLFRVEGIPKTFVYDRSGKMVAQSIDMRTRAQFLEMLKQAGLQ